MDGGEKISTDFATLQTPDRPPNSLIDDIGNITNSLGSKAEFNTINASREYILQDMTES